MGDFNSMHDSGVYELLKNGKVWTQRPSSFLTSNSFPVTTKISWAMTTPLSSTQWYVSTYMLELPTHHKGLYHNLNLETAYTSEMPYSNYTPTFKGKIASVPSLLPNLAQASSTTFGTQKAICAQQRCWALSTRCGFIKQHSSNSPCTAIRGGLC